MRTEHFGDSYDVVKWFLLRTIAPRAQWAALPMFTHKVSREKINAYASFLGVKALCPAPLRPSTKRAERLKAMAHHQHVFIDPDTGIKLKQFKGTKSVKYVFAPELIELCRENPQRLLLIFDQSIQRGDKGKGIKKKLALFRAEGVHGFAYNSHACFIVLSGSESVCGRAKEKLVASSLPSSRLILMIPASRSRY